MDKKLNYTDIEQWVEKVINSSNSIDQWRTSTKLVSQFESWLDTYTDLNSEAKRNLVIHLKSKCVDNSFENI
jgi:hypothetical protein